MTELVKYSVSKGIAILTFDSQHNRNALSKQLVTEFHEGLGRAAEDDEVKVVVVRAEGRTFCSGADLSEASDQGMEQAAGVIVELQRSIVTHPKPVITRLHGAVRAGGIGIVAASDIAISADDATYAFTEVKLALTPAAISLTVLPRMTDRSAGLTFLTGETFDGRAAAEAGLVTVAVPESDLDAEVDKVCSALVTGHPQGLRETKRLLGAHLVENIDTNGGDLAKLSARLFGSDEAREAMLSFLSRKKK
ncbi:MAG: enoyl-CoA hydratase family protein [Nocardioides sp.]|nr:enoyl-CoA hydratase family protein [Nocardioides sp.]